MKLTRFEYRGFGGCQCLCDLEILPLRDGRTVVTATEREDNPGTSVTNVAEYLASYVCERFGIAPENLVWIETYGYPGPGDRERTFDLVTFKRREPDAIRWSQEVTRRQPSGWPGIFAEPEWKPMTEQNCIGLCTQAQMLPPNQRNT